MSGDKPRRARMDCKPPPPPVSAGQSQTRIRSARRPKTPPPRRPPRPVVKQKDDQSHARTVSDTVAMISRCFDEDGTPVVSWADCAVSDDCHGNANTEDSNHSYHNNCEEIVKPSVPQEVMKSNNVLPSSLISKTSTKDNNVNSPCSVKTVAAKPNVQLPCSNKPQTQDIRLHGNHSNITVIRVPINRNKRRAPDVPRTESNKVSHSKLSGHGDVGISVQSQSKRPELTHRHSKSFSPADFSKDGSQHLDTLRLRKGSLDDEVLSRSKPVVQYAKVVHKDRGTDPDPCSLPGKTLPQSRSVDELDRYDIFLDLSDITCDYFYNQAFRSSFLEEATLKRQTIGFHSDVQTLLKHSHKETEHIYSLPQPASYSDTTLKAVKLITDKYDTLQRRRLHAASFREGDLAKLRGTLTLHRELSSKSDRVDAISPSKSLPSSPLMVRSVVREDKEGEDIVCGVTGLSKKDITRLEMFYRGRGTEIIVCTCLADLYLGNSAGPSSEVSDWLMYYTGVPLLVLNTGECKRKRELHLYLVERETGFPLWKDKINYLTNLEVVPDNPKVITIRLSGSLSKMAKFSIFCSEAATKFHEDFVSITTDPNDELWRVSSENTKESKKALRRKRKKWKSFTIHDISQPCNFQHINRVDPCDPRALASVSLLLESNMETTHGMTSSLNSSVIEHAEIAPEHSDESTA